MSNEELAQLLALLTQEHLEIIKEMVAQMNAHSKKIERPLALSLVRHTSQAA